MSDLESIARLQAQARAERRSQRRRSQSRIEIRLSRSMSPQTDELWSPLSSPADDAPQRARTTSSLREPVRAAPGALQRRESFVRPYEPGAGAERVSAGVDEMVSIVSPPHHRVSQATAPRIEAARPSSASSWGPVVRPTSAATRKHPWRTSVGFAGSLPAVESSGGRGRNLSLPVTPSLAGAPTLSLRRTTSPLPSGTDSRGWRSSKAFAASTPVFERTHSDDINARSSAKAEQAR